MERSISSRLYRVILCLPTLLLRRNLIIDKYPMTAERCLLCTIILHHQVCSPGNKTWSLLSLISSKETQNLAFACAQPSVLTIWEDVGKRSKCNRCNRNLSLILFILVISKIYLEIDSSLLLGLTLLILLSTNSFLLCPLSHQNLCFFLA